MFLYIRRVLLIFLICLIIGCGETEEQEPVSPVVTIEFLGYKDVDEAEFLLRAKPHTDDLHILIEFAADEKDTFQLWKAIPKGPGALRFTVPLDGAVSWDVAIIAFSEDIVTDYPVASSELSSAVELRSYELGDPSSTLTSPYIPTDGTGTNEIPEGMVLIPEGEFLMGSRLQPDHTDEQPIHTVFIDAFYIDTHEVTIGEYKQFVEITGYRAIPDWVEERSPTDQHPIIGVSWHDAMAYARWIGKRLPTEAEWEYAARGGLKEEKYPWGNDDPDGTQANYADVHVVGLVWNFDGEEQLITWADEDVDDGYLYNAPVGSYIPNDYGLYDMAGNVWEWCLDEYDPNFYRNSPRENPSSGDTIKNTILNSPLIVTTRVHRGGSHSSDANGIRVAHRGGSLPTRRFNDLGFRCVLPLNSDLSNLDLKFE